ncbi:MAG: GAF domain-containing protein [Armatimonadota bacterium]
MPMRPHFSDTLLAIREQVATSLPAEARLQRAMELVHEQHSQYEWVGIYVLRGDVLELGPHVGAPTEHVRIRVGEGVCGTAVAQERNQVVEDVRQLDNYLACSPSVRSEIVVLMRDGEEVLGEIDADSDDIAAFGPDDEAFLTQVAALLAPLVREIR